MENLSVVILAAGQGTRMRSEQPKVLHHLAGKPLIQHVLDTAEKLSSSISLVYGQQQARLQQALCDYSGQWVHQPTQQGTGHAVQQVLPHLPSQDRVLILYGDVPLITFETLQNLIDTTPTKALGLLTVELDNPTGFGRIKRDANGKITHIVEDKDASLDEKQIKEVNSGIYVVPCQKLATWLPKISANNAQQEFYLTDIVALAAADNTPIVSSNPCHLEEILGVNDKIQLATLERYYQRKQARDLMQNGATILDPERLDIRGSCEVGMDVVIDVGVVLEGHVVLGDRCTIGAHSVLRDVYLDHDVQVKTHSVIEEAKIGAHCTIGPFARIRPNTVLDEQVMVGNFVELKKTTVGKASKISHLSYIGDASLGEQVNIGAGTITCNYDGVNKHLSQIGNKAFIGSNTSLVGPVDIGERATIGASSVITQNAPAAKLTLARARQQTIEHWVRPDEREKQ